MRGMAATLAKCALATALIAWMLRNGSLAPGNLLHAFKAPGPLLLACGIILLMTCLGIVRWRILVQGQGVPLPLGQALAYGLIGNFFSTFIPGAVGGDIVRGYYLAANTTATKTSAAVSILADRTLGMFALLAVCSVQGGFFIDAASINESAQQALRVAGLLCAAMLAVGLPALLVLRRTERIRAPERNERPLLAALGALGSNAGATAAALGISLTIVLLIAPCLHFIGLALGNDAVGLGQYMAYGPLILLTMALPIAPAGIGTGQAAALLLFHGTATAGGSFGADMVTLFQIIRFALSLIGGLLYIHHPAPAPPTGRQKG